ncbi:MAG: RnfD, RnfE family, partial [Gaiellaceae bacterium]|jgi:hypothetical protein|nr:RnfD, RnfE family [Gaiellaceae bacterium]
VLAIIVVGGFAILWRLKLLRVALSFWISFTAAIGLLAAAGHTMVARWHLGPISGFALWWVLITSPEVLVFLFFMITDPKTAPSSPRGRIVYGISLGLLAAVLIAPTTSEFAAKVMLLAALAIVSLALPLLRLVPAWLTPRGRIVAPAALALAAAAIFAGNAPALPSGPVPLPPGAIPPIKILPSKGVQTPLDRHTAKLIAHALVKAKPVTRTSPLFRIRLVKAVGQAPPTAEVVSAGHTYDLDLGPHERWELTRPASSHS